MKGLETQPTESETVELSEVQFPDINTVEGRDEILRRAVEEERKHLRITPGQYATLQAAKKGD